MASGLLILAACASPKPRLLPREAGASRVWSSSTEKVEGGTLEAMNSDAVLHTTHLYGPAEVNISLPMKGARSARQIDDPGPYAVRCDVHGWMQAVVRVDRHPFHAVTAESGAFRIEGIPPGRYRVEAWHERLGARESGVVVKDGAATRPNFEYR
jgi:hypothetical protein